MPDMPTLTFLTVCLMVLLVVWLGEPKNIQSGPSLKNPARKAVTQCPHLYHLLRGNHIPDPETDYIVNSATAVPALADLAVILPDAPGAALTVHFTLVSRVGLSPLK